MPRIKEWKNATNGMHTRSSLSFFDFLTFLFVAFHRNAMNGVHGGSTFFDASFFHFLIL